MATSADTNEKDDSLLYLTTSRANVYELLARCFKEEIDRSCARDIANGFEFDSNDEELACCFELMRSCLKVPHKMQDEVEKKENDLLERLAVDFDRIFFGMGPLGAKAAFPYESVYTSTHGIMMQDAYTQMKDILRESGLAKSDDFLEPEDHIAVELAFMAHLAKCSNETIENGSDEEVVAEIKQQRSFLRKHLLNWTDRFCKDLEACAGQGFYLHLAKFTQRFLHFDEKTLCELLS